MADQRNKKSHTPGEKDDTTGKTEDIIVGQALHDEENGTYQKQEPTHKVKSLFCLIDVQTLRN